MIFRCPVCRATVYEQLALDSAAGSRLLSTLYACAGCTIVFVDPARVSRPGTGVPGQPAASPDFARVHVPGKSAATRPGRGRSAKRARPASS